MNKIGIVGLIGCLLLFTGCTSTENQGIKNQGEPLFKPIERKVKEREKPDNLMAYSGVFTSVGVGPQASKESKVDFYTLVLRGWVDDSLVHIYLPEGTYEKFFESEDQYLPGSKILIDGQVSKLKGKLGHQYYEVWKLKNAQFLAYPTTDEMAEIFQSYSSCEVDSDCEVIGGICPLECYIGVNKDGFETSKKIMAAYERRLGNNVCSYNCPSLHKVVCRYNTCVPSYSEETSAQMYEGGGSARIPLLCSDELIESGCDGYEEPACGSNGITYKNACEACLDGVEEYVEGECYY